MYYAIGFKEEDFNKQQVGVVSMGWDGNPCNMHLNDLSTSVRESINKVDGFAGPAFLYNWRE
jgi:dihydroxy-acid dehydratase